MKYIIGQEITVKSNKVIKTIIDCERIEGINIYYMSDKTSYSEEELSDLLYVELSEISEISDFALFKLIDIENTVKRYSENMGKFLKNSKSTD
jgi:hypothetical protein